MEVEMSDDHQSSQSVVRMKKGRGRLPDPVWTKNGLQARRHAMGPLLSSRFFRSPSLCSLDLPCQASGQFFQRGPAHLIAADQFEHPLVGTPTGGQLQE